MIRRERTVRTIVMTRRGIEDVQEIVAYRTIEMVGMVKIVEKRSGNVTEVANDAKIDMMTASDTAGIKITNYIYSYLV